MEQPRSDRSVPAPHSSAPLNEILRDSIRYWEPRRIAYNVALTALAIAVVARTWPHFQPAIAPRSIPRVAILVALANGCYCAAYFVEVVMGPSSTGAGWRRWRWCLWLAGTLFAMFIELYWILDEIYPDVTSTH